MCIWPDLLSFWRSKFFCPSAIARCEFLHSGSIEIMNVSLYPVSAKAPKDKSVEYSENLRRSIMKLQVVLSTATEDERVLFQFVETLCIEDADIEMVAEMYYNVILTQHKRAYDSDTIKEVKA